MKKVQSVGVGLNITDNVNKLKGGIDGQDGQSISALGGTELHSEKTKLLPNKVTNNTTMHCIFTPCLLNGQKVIAFVDEGADVSFISKTFVEKNGLNITKVQGKIIQCLDHSSKDRIGYVDNIVLENSNKKLNVRLEVAELTGIEEVLIGVDLFKSLGYQVTCVPFTWPDTSFDHCIKKEVKIREVVEYSLK